MKTIDEDIKSGQFKRVYLLFGEEAYLKHQYKRKLKQALVASDDTMNFSSFEGKDTNPKAIIDLAETLPFFADRRLILIENSGFFKNSCEELAAYLPELPESTCLVFVEEEIDKRSKMYKAAQKTGSVVEFKKQTDEILIRWILGRLKKEKRNITTPVMQLFLSRTGTDMENIDRELEKLICYTMGKDVIEAADVEAVCVGQTTNKIFEMVNAIAEKNQKKALSLYYDLLALKEPPMRILFLIARQYNLLYQTKLLKGKGYDNKSIASKLGLSPFIAGKYVTQASRFEKETLRKSLEQCVEAEENVKTGKMADNLSVELLIVQFSSKKSQRKEA